MSWVKFDLESDGRFLASVKDLGADAATRIISTLSDMSGAISWIEMLEDYRWQEIPISPVDSYPGANQYYGFLLYFSANEIYEIVALNYAPPDVVCVLARAIRLTP